MKKNMLAVLILIVCIVNLTLTAYMVFTVVPNAQRTDTLITRILQIIDLELESPLPADINVSYSIDDVEKFEVGDDITANLAPGSDGKSHYAKISASLTINNKDEDYARLNPKVEVMKSDIISIIKTNVSRHTSEELTNPDVAEEVKAQILIDIQTLFNSKFIVDCTVDYLLT